MQRLPKKLLAGVVTGFLLGAPVVGVHAVEPSGQTPPPAWPTSPFHGVISGATGQPIPCRCRFQGAEFGLGATVCMNTHLGVQLARCDLFLNNTTWVPIGVPCVLSGLPAHLARASVFAKDPWQPLSMAPWSPPRSPPEP
jgi:hypothetical protein